MRNKEEPTLVCVDYLNAPMGTFQLKKEDLERDDNEAASIAKAHRDYANAIAEAIDVGLKKMVKEKFGE